MPRFILLNKLPYPIIISQCEIPFKKQVLEPYSKICYNFHNDSPMANKKMIIRDFAPPPEQVNPHWSSLFYIEDIDDFLLPFESNIPLTKDGIEWYEPKKANNNFKCIRVSIFSKDEATLYVMFSTPNSPDFIVRNETEEDVIVETAATFK